MESEFANYGELMTSLDEFVTESARHWASCDRLKLQLEYARGEVSKKVEKSARTNDCNRKPISIGENFWCC